MSMGSICLTILRPGLCAGLLAASGGFCGLRAEVPLVQATVFKRDILPVLEQACIGCHGPRKARGGLRLDSREAAMAGGDSGSQAISVNRPEASEVLRRIKLPRDHDDAMPPQNKPGLAPGEIAAMQVWIAAGAPWR